MNISKENSLLPFHFEEKWCPPLPAVSSLSHLLPSFLAVLVPVPDQQFTARPDAPAGPVENLSAILKGHQVLLSIVAGTVHIPGLRQVEGKKTTGAKFPACQIHVQLLT